MPDADLIVVGAGPVGMLATLLAVKKGLSVILLEKKTIRSPLARAIGISPPTLEIFESAGIAGELINIGVQVSQGEAYSSARFLGKIDFAGIKSKYRFILAIPQEMTESVLYDAVLADSQLPFYRGHHVTGFRVENEIIIVSGFCDTESPFEFSGSFVLACDGEKSTMREAAGIRFKGAEYGKSFLMGDFHDKTGWGSKARLYFTSGGSVESFPLPGRKRRFVLRTPVPIKEYESDFLRQQLPLRSGIDITDAEQFWESGFSIKHYMARKFYWNRVFFCGDAAHVMSPIGGQNMNTGFADAELAVQSVKALLKDRGSIRQISALYNRCRRRAAQAATNRAALMTLIGTSGGPVWSAVRNTVIFLLLHLPVKGLLASMFTMQSIPCRNLRVSRAYIKKVLKI